jgi:transposase
MLGVTQLFVRHVVFEDRGLVIDVRPRWKQPRCGRCGCRSPGYDRSGARLWRHLNLGRLRIWLQYAPRRVNCPSCGVVGEQVPWAEHDSRFTTDFEELTAYLASSTDKTAVSKLMGISWSTVGAIVERVVERRLAPDRLDDLTRIGIDEFSYRRRHRYLTIVVDHVKRRVVWAAPGRSADTLRGSSITSDPSVVPESNSPPSTWPAATSPRSRSG